METMWVRVSWCSIIGHIFLGFHYRGLEPTSSGSSKTKGLWGCALGLVQHLLPEPGVGSDVELDFGGGRIDVGGRIEVVAQQDDMVATGGVFDGEDVFKEGEVFVEVGYDEDAHVFRWLSFQLTSDYTRRSRRGQ